MCGIAGLISLNPERQIGAMLKHRTSRPRRRRRLDLGSDRRPGSARLFGHRRLAIIDTSSAGHQPMFSADGRYVITSGGEIYNYRELRDELKPRATSFGLTPTRKCCWPRLPSGARMSAASQRHVCVRGLGQSGAHADAGARSRRHQAALLLPRSGARAAERSRLVRLSSPPRSKPFSRPAWSSQNSIPKRSISF